MQAECLHVAATSSRDGQLIQQLICSLHSQTAGEAYRMLAHDAAVNGTRRGCQRMLLVGLPLCDLSASPSSSSSPAIHG